MSEGRGWRIGKSKMEDENGRSKESDLAILHPRPSILDPNVTRHKYADHVWIQDYAVQVGQGPYELRKQENLGRSDTPLILQRKIWIRELQALADGAPLTPWNRSDRIRQLISYSHVPEPARAKN